MQSSYSQQQQQQKKDLSVYDFNADNFAVEAASAKYSTRVNRLFLAESQNRTLRRRERRPSIKNYKNMDANEMPCIDVRESDSPQNSSGIDSPERIIETTDEKSGLEKNMTSSESYQMIGNECLTKLDPETLVPVEPHVTRATGLVVPLAGNERVSNLQADGTLVDVISIEEGSSRSGSESASTSVSDHVADKDYLEHPLSENYFAAPGEKLSIGGVERKTSRAC